MIPFGAWYRDFLDDLRKLLQAGFSITAALESLCHGGGGRRSTFAHALLERVQAGATLAEAFASRPEVPDGHAAVVEAGERAGSLDRVLARLVETLDRRREVLEQYLPRVLYPVAIASFAVALMPLVLIFTGHPGRYLLIQVAYFSSLGVVAFLLWTGPSFWPRGSPPRRFLERLSLGLPGVGRIVTDTVLGRVFGLIGILLEAGLPISESLQLAARAARWESFERAFLALEPAIRSGKTLTEAMGSAPLLGREPMCAARIAVGEKSGTLDRSFLELGAAFEDRARGRLALGLRFLPFILIPLVGAFVLFQAIGVMSGIQRGF